MHFFLFFLSFLYHWVTKQLARWRTGFDDVFDFQSQLMRHESHHGEDDKTTEYTGTTVDEGNDQSISVCGQKMSQKSDS